MTQDEFAAALRVTQGRMSQIEKRGWFSDELKAKILLLAKSMGLKFRPEWFDAIPMEGTK